MNMIRHNNKCSKKSKGVKSAIDHCRCLQKPKADLIVMLPAYPKIPYSRTPQLLVSLAEKYPEIAAEMSKKRPLLSYVLIGNQEELQRLLRDEEDREREADRQYWEPLKRQLEKWRLGKGP